MFRLVYRHTHTYTFLHSSFSLSSIFLCFVHQNLKVLIFYHKFFTHLKKSLTWKHLFIQIKWIHFISCTTGNPFVFGSWAKKEWKEISCSLHCRRISCQASIYIIFVVYLCIYYCQYLWKLMNLFMRIVWNITA